MKQLPIALACSVVVSLGLYGLLNAVDRPAAEPADPWLDAWKAAGFEGQFLGISQDPAKDMMFGDGRELVKKMDLDGTMLRRYLIQQIQVQVVSLTDPALLPEFPEGRNRDFRLRPRGSITHLCRSGRHFMLVRAQMFILDEPAPEPLVRRLWSVFEETAARYP